MAVATSALFTGVAPDARPRASRDLIALYNGTDADGPYAIGAASSTDGGATWTPDAGNPVMSKGAGGQWDDEYVMQPHLLRVDDTLVVYYAGFDGATMRIGRATASALGGPWTKYASNPVLTVGSGGAFDDAGVFQPIVLYEPADVSRPWKMWYAGDNGSDTYTVGYAWSADGLSWTKVGKVLDIGVAAAWDDLGRVATAINKVDGTYHLSFGGRQGTTNPRWQGGVVTFTDPEGAYTPLAENPVMLARFNDAGTSQALTANTMTGSAVVTVASTAAWNVNEPMALSDANSQPHVALIASIDSGTQVTLGAVATADFTTAQSAVIRPLAYNSVSPRTIIRDYGGAGWAAYLVAFQPVEDLTVSGTKLREGSMRATAPTVDGPWTYDYTAGLLLPMSGWSAISAENLSTVAAA
jgi:hypothetical protein